MGSDPADGLDPRVSENRQISLTRSPRLVSDLAQHFPYHDTEQAIIKQALRDQLSQYEKGITPEEMLSKFRAFAERADEIAASVDDEGDVRFECDYATLALEGGDEGPVTLSLSLEDED